MRIYQIGSSIEDPATANDLDLLIVSDKPVDICLYTLDDWEEFLSNESSCHGQRVVLYPRKNKGSKLNGNIRQILPVESGGKAVMP